MVSTVLASSKYSIKASGTLEGHELMSDLEKLPEGGSGYLKTNIFFSFQILVSQCLSSEKRAERLTFLCPWYLVTDQGWVKAKRNPVLAEDGFGHAPRPSTADIPPDL